VAFSDLQPGDVLFFQNTVWAGLSHTAIYVGGGRFIHAEWYNRGVVTSSFTNDPVDGNYWTEHYLGANRPWTGAAEAPVAVQPTPTPQPTPIPRIISPAPIPQATRQLPSGPTAVVGVPSLNVRSGPSFGAGIITSVGQGTRLVVLGRRRGWFRVALPGGAIGWVIGAGIGKGATAGQGSRSGNQTGAQVSAFRGAGTRRPRHRFGNRRAGNGRSASPVVPRSVAITRKSAPGRIEAHGWVTVDVAGLRVHTAPSLEASVVGSVNRGQRLAVARRTGSWIKVQLLSGGPGWISSRFVQQEVPRRIQKAAPVTRRSGHAALTARAALNVRANPSLSGAIVSVLTPGGAYQILHWSNGWARVRLSGGVSGWISGTVLGARAPSGQTSVRKIARTKPAAHSATDSIARAALNVRLQPSLGAAIVSIVPPDGKYRILGWSAGWAHVRMPDGGIGWISGSVLGSASTRAGTSPARSQGAKTKTQSTADTSSVITAGVRFRSGPSLTSATIRLVAAGTHVRVLGGTAGWEKVRLPSHQTGYILGIYVRE
jgi:uncharacterized protein YgiM (DUF1202 family)